MVILRHAKGEDELKLKPEMIHDYNRGPRHKRAQDLPEAAKQRKLTRSERTEVRDILCMMISSKNAKLAGDVPHIPRDQVKELVIPEPRTKKKIEVKVRIVPLARSYRS